MNNNIDFDIIKRYCEENFDKKDIPYIYSLFSENEKDEIFQQYMKDDFFNYIKTEPEERKNLSHVLSQIHRKIHKKRKRNKLTLVSFIYRWYSAIAAIFLIPVIVAGYIWLTANESEPLVAENEIVTTTIHAPLGSRINFILPDGTAGWLNSGSSLTYNIPFSKNRNVSVLGEVWFDVIKDGQHPFEVNSGNSKIEVYGTKFNISAYPDEKYVEVVLEEGKVAFSNNSLNPKIEMEPNERLLLKDGEITIYNIDASKYTAWKEGKIIFRGDSMNEVARRIERWYNIEVELVDKELESFVIRGIFQDDSLEEVLHFLSMTSPIKYKIIDRPVDNSESVQKKKVLIYIKDKN